ncbi:endonuclease III [Desulfuribacillus alkaliarsenatis]|uniref:Endonuclease III n=1 Tax=Desulfuribacillus alkaliarsenatis TaxID=766136 RepID=A0A1E5G0P2_9FIRM|nr:endonuclease III [Desulfuribacillus alkaliarsenatis]OEF96482.1 endonuclease III [Desulfuribacillus alkaliarsenatis]
MTKKQAQVLKILDKLEQMYPDAKCELEHTNAFELLIATILSAQCTDQRVNEVTKSLFVKYKSPADYTRVEAEEIAEDIYGLGLYKNKSKAIKKTAHILVEEHNGEVPSERIALEKLPGVGRKTANVVLSNAFGVPAIAVDTHVFRVSNRLGLAASDNVLETEQQLMTIIPKGRWSQAHHQLIFHGRRICYARKPNCSQCQLADLCQSALLF